MPRRARFLRPALAALAILACARPRPEPGGIGEPDPEAGRPSASAEARGAREVDVEHYRIAIVPDFASRRIDGEATIRFRTTAEGGARLVLDCVDLDVYGVEEAGVGPLRYETDGRRLVVDLARPRGPAEGVTVSIRYGGAPARGVYFRAGIGADGSPAPQLFTQGEPEETRCWVPCVDDPADRATSEILATVPESLATVAAGVLVSRTPDPTRGLRTDHWRMDRPHVAYLLTLVAGAFEVVEDRWRDVPLQYVVEPGDVPLVEPTFGRTPEILEFLAGWIGVPYPWPRYAQVCVRDFLWGGMENVSATTLTRKVLHPAELEREASAESLVAHEAAHQWFGDLLTCAGWEDLWLNEGFASYLDLLFRERARGWDEFRFEMLESQEAYVAACREDRRLPIAWGGFSNPDDLFDEHVYEGGAARLDLLRSILGDGEFRRAIGAWARDGSLRSVTTEDLRLSLERTCGRSLRPFFEDWVRGAGYPEIRVREEVDATGSLRALLVEQTHDPVAGTAEAFRAPVDVFLEDEEGRRSLHRFEMRSRRDRFVLPSGGRPRLVRFDPASRIPKRLDHEKPLEAWIFQLERDPEAVGRIEAIEALATLAGAAEDPPDAGELPWEPLPAQAYPAGTGPEPGSEAARALHAVARATAADPFWGVKRRSAEALGRIGGPTSREALVALSGEEDPRLRRAAAAALGRFEGDLGGSQALRRLLEQDTSPFVAGAAARAIGRIGAEGSFDMLRLHLERRSYHEEIRAGVLEGLAELDDARGAREAARFVGPSADEALRPRAISVLGRLGRRDVDSLAILEGLLLEDGYNARRAAAAALGEAEDALALAILGARLASEPDGRVRASLEESIGRVEERIAGAGPAGADASLPLRNDGLLPSIPGAVNRRDRGRPSARAGG